MFCKLNVHWYVFLVIIITFFNGQTSSYIYLMQNNRFKMNSNSHDVTFKAGTRH